MNGDQKLFEEKTIRTTPIYQGKIISLQVDEVELPNGEIAKREIVKHPGAVAVIALHEGKMIVVEQYRKPLEKSQVEIPAGKLEPGENPLEAAKRELEEETGFACGSIQHVSSFYTSPGFADELLHLYVAEQLSVGHLNPDDDEFIACTSISLEEAKALIANGRISDAKTIIAVYAWQVYQLTGKFA